MGQGNVGGGDGVGELELRCWGVGFMVDVG